MKITPTPITAALAGAFSAIVWPFVWGRYGGSEAGSLELMLATVLAIALPAHAFVLGFAPVRMPGERAVNAGLLKRIGVWVLAAAATALVTHGVRA